MILEVEQGSDAWLAVRYGRLTATRLACILGLGYDSPRRTWEIMTGRRPEQSASRAMAHGSTNEAFAADEFAFRTGLTLAEVGTVVHDRLPFLSASPDRLVGSDAVLEVKCPYRNGLPATVEDLNAGYLAQVVLQLACLDDRETAWLMHYVAPGCPLERGSDRMADQRGAAVVHRIRRDQSVERAVLDRAAAWYMEHICRGTEPESARKPDPELVEALRATVTEEAWRIP